jgi:hypothetical protein
VPGVTTTIELSRGDDGKREVRVEPVAGFVEVSWEGRTLRLTPNQVARLRDALEEASEQAKRLAQTVN